MSAEKKLKVIFVINPNAGTKSKTKINKLIKQHINTKIDYQIIQEKTIKNAEHTINAAIQEKPFAIIAIGGDGSVNYIAQKILGTSVALGVLPCGSGNGLARHLAIPMNLKKALQIINNLKTDFIDVGYINEKPFLCAAGTGFDATVIQQFDKTKFRGLLGYLFLALKLYLSYKPKTYTLEIAGKQFTQKAFLITIANAAQYGNDAFIAPHANIKDGKLDVCILKPFRFYNIPQTGWRLFNKTIDKSSFWEFYHSSEVKIYRDNKEAVHYDGEPAIMDKELDIKVKKKALKVLVP